MINVRVWHSQSRLIASPASFSPQRQPKRDGLLSEVIGMLDMVEAPEHGQTHKRDASHAWTTHHYGSLDQKLTALNTQNSNQPPRNEKGEK